MKDIIVEIKASSKKNKKYVATIKDINTNIKKKIDFGDARYQQYKDRTNIKKYSYKDHLDKNRRINYFRRFSKTNNKKTALKREFKKSGGRYTSKLLSHLYLW